MAVKITTLKEAIADNGLKIMVHGPAGAGKTVLCATGGEPTLIISNEAGLLSIADAPDYIHVAQVKTMADMYEVRDMLLQQVNSGNQQYSWVNLDSITEIAEVVLAEELKKSTDPRKAYGNLQVETNDLLKSFRDLPHYNVCMSCKQTRLTDDFSGVTTYVPMMPGAKLGPQIPYLFDEVFALRVEKDDEGEDYRVLQTTRDLRFEAKDRSGKLLPLEKPNLKYIKDKIKGESEFVPAPPFKKFWHHPESESVGICEAEQDWRYILEDGTAEEIDEATYNELLETYNNKEAEEE